MASLDASSSDAERFFQRIFHQLTVGCGRPTGCHTIHCASCKGGAGPMQPNDAAVLSLQLAAKGECDLCEDLGAYIDLDLVQFTQAQDTNDTSLYRALVIGAFSDGGLLQHSFPPLATQPSGEDNLARDLLVDWAQLDAFWLLVAGMPQLMDQIVEAITGLLESEAPLGVRAHSVYLSCPALADPKYHESTLALAYRAIAQLPGVQRDSLVRAWSGAPVSQLRHLVRCVHEFVIIHICEHSPLDSPLDSQLAVAVGTLGLLFRASEASAVPLELRAFYNDGVNAELSQHEESLRDDHRRWRSASSFSFCAHAFVLEPATKASVLRLDAVLQMRNDILRQIVLQSIQMDQFASPYLLLRVRRDELISDTLRQLASRSADLKKPLRVSFHGEEGLDEGGVRKEFFQLVMHQLFDPRWGMFVVDEKTRQFWFSRASLESSREFELVGTLLGIAIHNGVILDMHLPHVVYKKLMGAPCSFADLQLAFPALAHGLQQLLEHEGDVRALCLTYALEFDEYGARKVVELRPGGAAIEVTNENREDYVAQYTAYTLYASIQRQFEAFEKGFSLVCGGPTLQLFKWQELELLICGSPELDFEALQKSTAYDDGFTATHPTILLFWQVLHSLDIELKRRFLVFSTGSDRVPIKGLGNIDFVISRHGSDETRLPSAHTCFNHLLLPEYRSEEVMHRQLVKAITDTEGFHIV